MGGQKVRGGLAGRMCGGRGCSRRCESSSFRAGAIDWTVPASVGTVGRDHHVSVPCRWERANNVFVFVGIIVVIITTISSTFLYNIIVPYTPSRHPFVYASRRICSSSHWGPCLRQDPLFVLRHRETSLFPCHWCIPQRYCYPNVNQPASHPNLRLILLFIVRTGIRGVFRATLSKAVVHNNRTLPCSHSVDKDQTGGIGLTNNPILSWQDHAHKELYPNPPLTNKIISSKYLYNYMTNTSTTWWTFTDRFLLIGW